MFEEAQKRFWQDSRLGPALGPKRRDKTGAPGPYKSGHLGGSGPAAAAAGIHPRRAAELPLFPPSALGTVQTWMNSPTSVIASAPQLRSVIVVDGFVPGAVRPIPFGVPVIFGSAFELIVGDADTVAA